MSAPVSETDPSKPSGQPDASTPSATARRWQLSEDFSVGALFVLCVACALLLCAVPRAPRNIELPSLRLPANEVHAQLTQDARDQRVATQSADAKTLQRLFREHGEAEANVVLGAQTYRERLSALANAYAKLLAQEGLAGAREQRAWALSRFEAALEGTLPAAELNGVRGLFANVLDYHGVTRDGEELAPHFVTRTLYKARWNMFMGLAPDAALSRVELLAYHGWLALHAERLNGQRRMQALQRYAAAGGERTDQAIAGLLFRDGVYDAAAKAFEHAYAESGNIRIRNYLLTAQLAATAP